MDNLDIPVHSTTPTQHIHPKIAEKTYNAALQKCGSPATKSPPVNLHHPLQSGGPTQSSASQWITSDGKETAVRPHLSEYLNYVRRIRPRVCVHSPSLPCRLALLARPPPNEGSVLQARPHRLHPLAQTPSYLHTSICHESHLDPIRFKIPITSTPTTRWPSKIGNIWEFTSASGLQAIDSLPDFETFRTESTDAWWT